MILCRDKRNAMGLDLKFSIAAVVIYHDVPNVFGTYMHTYIGHTHTAVMSKLVSELETTGVRLEKTHNKLYLLHLQDRIIVLNAVCYCSEGQLRHIALPPWVHVSPVQPVPARL